MRWVQTQLSSPRLTCPPDWETSSWFLLEANALVISFLLVYINVFLVNLAFSHALFCTFGCLPPYMSFVRLLPLG